MVAKLDGVVELLTVGNWATAAIVWAYTSDGGQGYRPPRTSQSCEVLTPEQFADLGIRGLNLGNSVRKYRKRWQEAIDDGVAEPAEPGQRVRLPDLDFKADGKAHVSNNSGENDAGHYMLCL